MLGRTNITTIKGGTVISDVENFVWNEVGTLQVEGAFKRTFFGNNTLVAISEGGTVIYSKDGENWERAVFEVNAECKIVDGVWDGKQFVFAANNPVIITTEDLQEYKKYEIPDVIKLYAIFYNINGTYTVLCGKKEPSLNEFIVSFFKGIPENLQEVGIVDTRKYRDEAAENLYVKTAYSENILICYIKGGDTGVSDCFAHQVGVTEDGVSVRKLLSSWYDVHNKYTTRPANFYEGPLNKYKIFSLKNALYYMDILEESKKLIRIKDFSDEKGDVVSTGKDWGFIGGEYFNKCDIFVNTNQMLVVKPGEYIAEKTIEDLIDITYDFSITNIIKAFGKLYLFGTNGHILVSSNEIRDENALAVKSMSARKALYEAKEYTDKKYEELVERIARIEEVNNGNSTEV